MYISRLRPSSKQSRLKSGGALVALATIGALVLTACGSSSTADPSTSAAAAGTTAAASGAVSPAAAGAAASDPSGETASAATASGAGGTLRLGYFPNVTHAAAVLGVADGTFATALGSTSLETQTFNAGPAAIEALLSGAIDATFIGPNPAINAFAQSNGDAIRIVAGTTDNGAALVVKPEINSAADLAGKTLASPQLGGTQDVALRKYLLANGLKTQTTGGSDVDIVNQENAQTLDLFKSGEIDGGWLPEPWASRLVLEAGGKVLVDEKTLWPDQKFLTTHLIVATPYLESHPDQVSALLEGLITETEAIEADPATAQTELNAAIGELTGKPLAEAVIARSFGEISPTWDPLASALPTIADDGVTAGTLKEKPSLEGIYDLTAAERGAHPAGQTRGRGQRSRPVAARRPGAGTGTTLRSRRSRPRRQEVAR